MSSEPRPRGNLCGELMNKRLNTLLLKLARRDREGEDEAFLDQSAIRYLGRKVFNDYEPSQFEQFEDRLDRWLHNVAEEEDRRTLFLLLNRPLLYR